MVKKYKSRKTTKKLKKIKYVKHKLKKVVNSKKKKYKISPKTNFPQKEPKNNPKNAELSNIFLDAQASVKVLCCSCNKNITNQIKIILEPMTPNDKILQKGLSFNALCIECFTLKTKFNSKENVYYVGNEITLFDFKFTHFIILNKMTENIFTNDWTLADEIKLLGAIEKLGLENWEEISKILNKGKFECESHYYTFYYKAKDDYFPSTEKINLNNSSKNLLKENKKEENKNILKIEENIGYIPFSENNKPNRSISKNIIKKDDQGKNKPVNQNMYDSLGYWEKRKDFDIEFKNEAEIQLSELEFNKEDSPAQIKINYKNLKNYNNILDEREERKKLVEEKNLFDVRKQINFDKKISNQDREIYQNVKSNLKYLTREQFLFFYESNVLEKNIKARLNQLLFYKNIGCKTYDDIQKYLNEIKKENIKKKEQKDQKDDDKMKLRTSTIISTNKLSELYNKGKKQKKDKKDFSKNSKN
jgi:transcriptional adapter 2-alpha